MPSLIGNKPNQVPTNGDLGKLAFMDVVNTVSNNPYYDTAISDVQPTLNLDFVNSKTLDPRITFARASTATFYNANGSAKAEENLFLQSQTTDQSPWARTATTISADNTTAPDGTSTAEKLAETATTSGFALFQIFTPATTTETFSVFLKKGTGATAPNWAQLYVSGSTSTSWSAAFDLQNGVVGTVGTNTTASIVNAGNGWYRCVIVVSNLALSSRNFSVGFTNNTDTADKTTSYAGVTTSDVFVWGAQREQRSSATAYTPTTTQAITNYIPTLQTAAINAARLDYDPITREPKGLLIEESRTNLLTYSSAFDNAAWTLFRSSLQPNVIIAPDGTLTGDKLVENTATDTHVVTQSVTLANATYSASCYLKAAERTFATFQMSDLTTGGAIIFVNLSTGTIVSSTATGSWSAVSSTITAVGNGWYRVTATGTKGAGTAVATQILPATNGTTNSYTGDGYSGIYIWGAQLEAGAFATSYIPTVASQVTRSADAASMTGTNFSSWYNIAEGTLYADVSVPTVVSSEAFVVDIGLTTANRMGLFVSTPATSYSYFIVTTNSTTVVGILPTYTGTNLKVSATYKTNDFAITNNGASVTTDSVGTIPSVSNLSIGARLDTVNRLNGTIKKLAYYPKRLTNAELQELTA